MLSVRTDCRPNVAVVESAQDGCRGDPSPGLSYGPGTVLDEVIGDLLLDALMRPGTVVVFDVSLHNTMQLVTMENEHVVQAFTPQAANEALTI